MHGSPVGVIFPSPNSQEVENSSAESVNGKEKLVEVSLLQGVYYRQGSRSSLYTPQLKEAEDIHRIQDNYLSSYCCATFQFVSVL